MVPHAARFASVLAAIAGIAWAQQSQAAGDHEHRARGAQRKSHTVTALPQPRPVPLPKDRAVDRVEHWYGWQTLSLDAAVFAAMYADRLQHLTLALGGYVASGPLVHVLHGRPKTAVLSVGARMSSIVGATAIAQYTSCTDYREDGQDRVDCSAKVTGVLLAILVAPVIDAALLSNPDAPAVKTSAHTARIQFGAWTSSEGVRISAVGIF